MSSDTDYISDKEGSKDNSSEDSSPKYFKWLIDVLKNFVYCLLLFTIGAGAIANASDPKYHDDTKDEEGNIVESFGNWLGTDVEGTPYCCPGERQPKSSGKKSAGSVIKEFFDLSKFNKPYNIAQVRRLLANELEIHKFNEDHENDNAELPEHLQPTLDSGIMMYPWAIRMTGYSYAYMRKFLQAGVLNIFPRFKDETNWKTSLAFSLGGFLLLLIFAILHILPMLFTIAGAVSSAQSFAWIGWEWLAKFCLPFFIPAILYIFVCLLGVPLLTGMVNNFVQPYFYLGFLFEPLFNNWKSVKEIMLAHSHIIGITGIIITVLFGFTDNTNAPSFGIGVLIAACLYLAMNGAKKHMQSKKE